MRKALKGGLSADFSSPALRRHFDDQDYTDRIPHVLSQIATLSQVKKGERFSFIRCPFHNEKTPSGRIFHDPSLPRLAGNFKCFGCSETRRWDELASVLNLEPFNKKVDPDRELFVPKGNLDEIEGKLLGGNEEEVSDLTAFPITKESAKKLGFESYAAGWRGFPFGFLKETGALFCRSGSGTSYLYLPVIVSGEERGFIRAQLKKPTSKTIPSYLNAPGPWSNDFGLYPYDYSVELMKSRGLSSIVLTEGPRDALRLLHLGFPALCILGTHSWSEQKFRLLTLSGAERLIPMFDGDAAGEKALELVTTGKVKSKVVAPELSSVFEVKPIRLWNIEEDPQELVSDSKFDPCNLPERMLLSFLERTVR